MVEEKVVRMSASRFKLEYFTNLAKKELVFLHDKGLNLEQIYYMKILYMGCLEQLYRFIGVDLLKTTNKISKKIENDIVELYSLGYLDKQWIKTKQDPYPDGLELTEKGKLLVTDLIGIDIELADKELIESKKRNKEKLDLEDKLTKELFEVYPNSTIINNSKIPLKSCKQVIYNNKEYKGKDGIGKLYCIIINYDVNKHQEIINKIQNDVTESLGNTNQSISNFVVNRTWEEMDNNNFIESI